ncbi:MAG: adenosylcobinamide-phosphate synthase CbiB [Cyanobacteriota bacterium]|nr:adenosylcobinamide-phosphate synthase CbiB [Cyanobacteriota bacterium]
MVSGGSGVLPHPALLLVLACALDRAIGDPRWCVHPVQVMGWLIQRLRALAEAWAADGPWTLRLCGVLITAGLVLGSAGVGWGVEQGAARAGPWLGGGVLVVALASALAGGSLERAVKEVLGALPDLALARQRLAWIVGREVEGLPASEILRAAAETTAENAVDGLFAPLFWMMVGAVLNGVSGGAPGPLAWAWAFKAASTLDSMLGYRRGRLLWLGTAGARLDDVLTWIPARLVALSLPLVAGRPWRVWQDLPRALGQGAPDPSPNAGVSQAAYALAVGVRLGGMNRYADGWRPKPFVGEGQRRPDRQSVGRMLALTLRLEVAWLVVFVGGWAWSRLQ